MHPDTLVRARGQCLKTDSGGLRLCLNLLLACWLLALFTLSAGAQTPSIAWQSASPGATGNPNSAAASRTPIAVDGAGNLFIAGNYNAGLASRIQVYKLAPDGSLIWSASYLPPSGSFSQATAVAVDSSGEVVVLGRQDDAMLTIRYRGSDGVELWSRTYTGPGNGDEAAEAAVFDSSGDVIVTGRSRAAGNAFDFATIKYDGDTGAEVWVVRYDGPAHSHDRPVAIVVDSNDDVIVTGSSIGVGTQSDYLTIKYRGSDGLELWEARYDGPGQGVDEPVALAVDASDDVLVTGRSTDAMGTFFEFATVKYAGNSGTQAWEARFFDPASGTNSARALALDGSGNAYVVGTALLPGPSNGIAVTRYAAGTGAEEWRLITDTIHNPVGLTVDSSGAILTAGRHGPGSTAYGTLKIDGGTGTELWDEAYTWPNSLSQSAEGMVLSGNDPVVTGRANLGSLGDLVTVRHHNSDGSMIWAVGEPHQGDLRERLSCNDDVTAKRALAIDPQGYAVVTGCGRGPERDEMVTARFDPDGVLQWVARYNGPGGGNDRGRAVTVDSVGDVYVTGESAGIATGLDYVTIRYDRDTGAEVWVSRYDGPASGDDLATAISIDATGDVVVTGRSQGSGAEFDYATLRLRGSDGHQLWESRYTGTGNGDDRPWALVIDPGGDVIVTGQSANATQSLDYATVRLAGSDGQLLWEHRYTHPFNGDDHAFAVGLDSTGNVLVSGFSSHPVSLHEIATVKIDGISGTQLWDQRYNGPDDWSDWAYDLVVDSTDDVIVTGLSFASPDFDMFSAKYDGFSASESWTERTSGPAGSDLAYAIALLAGDDVVITGRSQGVDGRDEIMTARLAGGSGAEIWRLRKSFAAFGSNRGYAVGVAPDGSLRVAGTVFTPAGERMGVIRIDQFESSTTALVQALPNPAVVGQPVSFTVQVEGVATAPSTGQVEVMASTGESCTSPAPQSVAGLIATFNCPIVFDTTGNRSVNASFSNSATHGDSATLSPLLQQIDPAATTLSITDVDPEPALNGQTSVVTVELLVSPPGAGSPTGIVLITDNLQIHGCAVSLPDLTCTIDWQSTGNLQLGALYAGDGNFQPSVSNPYDVSVDPAADLWIEKTNHSDFVEGGQPVTYQVTVGNFGPDPASGAVVEDILDPTDFSNPSWTCQSQAGGAICPAAGDVGDLQQTIDLPPGGELLFEVTGLLAALPEDPVSNTATITPPPGLADPDLANNSSTDGPDHRGLFADGFEG